MKIKLLNKNAKLPSRGSEDAAGWDLYSSNTEDIVVKPVFAVITLIEAITTIGIVGRDGTAGIIGIVDEVDFTSCILTLVEITIDVDLELELLRQVEVNLSHRRITTVGRIVDDIVLVGITYRSIVSHQL